MVVVEHGASIAGKFAKLDIVDAYTMISTSAGSTRCMVEAERKEGGGWRKGEREESSELDERARFVVVAVILDDIVVVCLRLAFPYTTLYR